MSDLDRHGRRSAEEAAGHELDGSNSSEENLLETAGSLGEDERTLYLRHLFVHGLLESLIEVDSDRVREAGEARIQGVVDTIRSQEPVECQGQTAGASRRWFRYAAAAVLIGALVVAGLLVLTRGGNEAMAAIDHALLQVNKGLDRHYVGEIIFDYEDGTRQKGKTEFISGPGRFCVEGLMPTGYGNFKIPFQAGYTDKVKWMKVMGMLMDFNLMKHPGKMSKRMKWIQHPSDYLGDVGTILTHMRQDCDLKMRRLESGLLHVEARPRKDEAQSRKERTFRFPRMDRIEIILNDDTHEVKSFTLHKGRFPGDGIPPPPIPMKPWKKMTIAFRHVKNFLAPVEKFLPPAAAKKTRGK